MFTNKINAHYSEYEYELRQEQNDAAKDAMCDLFIDSLTKELEKKGYKTEGKYQQITVSKNGKTTTIPIEEWWFDKEYASALLWPTEDEKDSFELEFNMDTEKFNAADLKKLYAII